MLVALLDKVDVPERVDHLPQRHLHRGGRALRAVLLRLVLPFGRGALGVLAGIGCLGLLRERLEPQLGVLVDVVPCEVGVELEDPGLPGGRRVSGEEHLALACAELVQVHAEPGGECGPFLVLLLVAACGYNLRVLTVFLCRGNDGLGLLNVA